MEKDYRKDFLLSMYNQMWNSINVHLTVVWQSIGLLISAFAIFALTEKGIVNLDIAISLIVLICGWLLAHLLDASYWYNRNLAIIANIEKEFLEKEDLAGIHHYFGEHPANRMIDHLRIQFALGVGITFMVLFLHLFARITPNLTFSDPQRVLPYVVLVLTLAYLYNFRTKGNKNYEEFLAKSPGIDFGTKKSTG